MNQEINAIREVFTNLSNTIKKLHFDNCYLKDSGVNFKKKTIIQNQNVHPLDFKNNLWETLFWNESLILRCISEKNNADENQQKEKIDENM